MNGESIEVNQKWQQETMKTQELHVGGTDDEEETACVHWKLHS